MKVPFLDLYASNRRHEEAFFSELKKLYQRSAFIGGPWLEKFEREFASASGSPYCVAVASGTSALHLALIAAGVGPGDEVIVPAFTFPGTAWGVLYLGATLVFADVRLQDGCIDPESVARKITPRTKAVIAVHLFGHPAPLNELRKVLRSRRVALIEDAAQAHGGFYDGKPLGSIGDFGCFSFYPTKNLGGLGDGGAILVTRKSLAERLRRLRDHGQRQKFFPEEIGYNSRMDAIQAMFLGLKLPSLKADNDKRTHIAEKYLEALKNNSSLIALKPSDAGISAWHAFVVRVQKRENLLNLLETQGIGYQLYYPATLPSLKPFRKYAKGKYPAAEKLAKSCVALPLHPQLKKSDVAKVIEVLSQ